MGLVETHLFISEQDFIYPGYLEYFDNLTFTSLRHKQVQKDATVLSAGSAKEVRFLLEKQIFNDPHSIHPISST